MTDGVNGTVLFRPSELDALRKRGIDVQYIVKDNEGHGFQNEENRVEFYEAMEKCLARHVKPARPKPVP